MEESQLAAVWYSSEMENLVTIKGTREEEAVTDPCFICH
jgi:hypothetical protein